MVNLILSFIITFILGIIIVPKLRSYNIGQIVREDGPKEHLKKTGTPTMGGIIILIVIITILIINSFEFPILILPIISILGFGLVGFIDDYKKLILKNTEGLSPKKKIIGLFLTIIVFLIFYLKVFDLSTEILIPYFNIGINLSLIVFILFTTFIMLRNFKCNKFNRWTRWVSIFSSGCNNDIFFNNILYKSRYRYVYFTVQQQLELVLLF